MDEEKLLKDENVENEEKRPETEEKLDEDWKRKRLTTFIVYNLLYFSTGFEQTLTITTSWTYVNTQIETDNKDFIYAGINTLRYLPALILVE